MSEKGFEAEIVLNETPNFNAAVEKPLNSDNERIKKVDINVLKARAQEAQDKENKKNIIIFIFFLTIIASIGIVLSI